MPYIQPARREDFQDFIQKTEGLRIDTAGELNFLITKLMLIYLVQHGENYRILNEIVGAASCAQMEFYRRQIIPFEDAKRQENGEVFLSVPGTE